MNAISQTIAPINCIPSPQRRISYVFIAFRGAIKMHERRKSPWRTNALLTLIDNFTCMHLRETVVSFGSSHKCHMFYVRFDIVYISGKYARVRAPSEFEHAKIHTQTHSPLNLCARYGCKGDRTQRWSDLSVGLTHTQKTAHALPL